MLACAPQPTPSARRSSVLEAAAAGTASGLLTVIARGRSALHEGGADEGGADDRLAVDGGRDEARLFGEAVLPGNGCWDSLRL